MLCEQTRAVASTLEYLNALICWCCTGQMISKTLKDGSSWTFCLSELVMHYLALFTILRSSVTISMHMSICKHQGHPLTFGHARCVLNARQTITINKWKIQRQDSGQLWNFNPSPHAGKGTATVPLSSVYLAGVCKCLRMLNSNDTSALRLTWAGAEYN